jgi:16S rRNA (uracil1498-N3)-methyltransferase
VLALPQWLRCAPPAGASRWLLSVSPGARAVPQPVPGRPLLCLSGPEGGWSREEEVAAVEAGFEAVSLGERVLRSDTAPLAVLAHAAMSWADRAS